jgi:glycosyltransferase involved in cell wall biosynthesis
MTAPVHQAGSILYVIGSLERGGAETYLSRLTPELVRRGWKVAIFCLSEPGSLAPDLTAAGVEVVSLESRSAAAPRVVRLARLVRAMGKLFVWMLRRKPDIVHFFLPAAYLIGAPLAIVARRPVLFMSRRSLNVYQLRHPLAARVERLLHRRMTVIIANSLRVRAELIEEGCVPARLRLIHNGVPSAPPAPPRTAARAALGIDASTFVMVLVANLIPYKGHRDLIEALATIAEQLPKPWRLLCVGRDDGIGADLASLVQSRGLAAHATFLGARQDVGSILAAADLGLLTSHEEGFSNALLEYMAASLPVVATDVGGNNEAVLDGTTGRLVPARDTKALAQAILDVARDGELARCMGAAGRQRLETLFSLEQSVNAHASLYREFRAL